MGRYILKISIATLFLLLNTSFLFAEVILLNPPNGSVLEHGPINFQWSNTDTSQPYMYELCVSSSSNFHLAICDGKIQGNEKSRWEQPNRIYYWRIRYSPLSIFYEYSPHYATGYRYEESSETFVFGIDKDIPQHILDEFVKEEIQEEDQESIVIEEKEEENIQSEITQEEEIIPPELPFLEKKVPITIPYRKSSIGIPHTLEEFNWNSVSSGKVLGISQKNESIVCRFKYLKKKISLEYCNLPKLELNKQERYQFGNGYILTVTGNVQNTFKIQIDRYDCHFNILKPITWFKCEERFKESNIVDVKAHMFFNVLQDWRNIPIMSYILDGDEFRLVAGITREKEQYILEHTYRISLGDYNLFHEEKNSYALNLNDYNLDITEPRPFIFPFKKIIGVTQWYGYTEYQSPHTGIDFGAKKENVLAVGDGEVVSKGWDSYYGDCLSGGNYLKIKQLNGMYTVYFHLEDIFVNTGDMVKRGDIVAISGNSGFWNCQKLAYHLHFETRINSSMNSHSNPVKYIDTDWHSVPTLGYLTYPGRLSGENPHPGR